jgi:transposase
MGDVFYGLDVSKGYADIARQGFGIPKKGNTWKINDNKEGVKELRELIKADLESGRCVFMGVESTGGYENNWYNNFIDFDSNVKVIRINPIRINHESKKTMVRNITDKVSSFSIANHLKDNREELVSKPKKTRSQANIASLVTLHQMLLKQRTQSFNVLEKIVYGSMPGLLKFWGGSCPDYLLELILKWPSKQKLIKTLPSSIAKIKGISFDKAAEIIATVKNDSGCDDDEIKSYEMKVLAQEIKSKNKIILELVQKFQSYEDYKTKISLLTSIPGCGAQSAAIINIEIGDINNFDSAKQMCGYFGTHPESKQSGDIRSKPQMSKKGSPQMRSTLYMIAMNSIKWSDSLKSTYAQQRANGKGHNSALGVVMNKLLRIIFGVLKSGKEFSEDIANSQVKLQTENTDDKKIEEIKKKIEILNIELQGCVKAPTSSLKKSRIKKAIKESQNSLDELKTRSSLSPETKV